MIFMIGTQAAGDYSDRVIAGSYNVQTTPIYNSWNDANGVEHRSVVRPARTSGSFDMFFKDITEYDTFVGLIESLRQNDLTVLCTVKSNNTNQLVTGDFYLEFAPVRNRKADWSDYMERFTVSITEA